MTVPDRPVGTPQVAPNEESSRMMKPLHGLTLAGLLSYAALLPIGTVRAATPAPTIAASAATMPRPADLCDGCAVVTEVKTETRDGKGGAVGVIGGAVIGGVIGHQIGGGTGKTLATIGGAAAGGYAGNEVQKKVNKKTVWITRATLRDGSVRTFENSADPGFKVGEVVAVSGNELKKR
jgi:outer membrane lipoprotein SlyB